MKESSTYQVIVEEGWLKGREEGRVVKGREDILRIGTKRFGKPPRRIRLAISAVTDSDRLDAMLDRALDASSWDELLAE